MKKRWLSIVLALVMALGLAPVPAQAAGIGETEIRVNNTKVAFGGHEWWVIGDGKTGVFPQEGHLTLWAANPDAEFAGVFYRRGYSEEQENTKRYRPNRDYPWVYYVKNPSGMKGWSKPAEYAGSTLQLKMEEMVNNLSAMERNLLYARTLTAKNDDIIGQDAKEQRYWVLSTSEYYSIHNIPVRTWEDEVRYLHYWARDADDSFGMRAHVLWGSGVLEPWTDPYFNYVYIDNWARPATTMSLKDVVFVSSADENGKSAATVGGGLVKATWPMGTLKYTMKSDALKLKVYAAEQENTDALRIAYSDATVGPNMYISCAVRNEWTGELYYYGKLADCSKSGSGTAEIRIWRTGNMPENVVVEIFSEQANGDLYTDFCSEPIIMKAVVKNRNTWTMTDFSGETHTHQWDQDNWTADDEYHWHDCKAANCPLRESNYRKDGYDWHRYDQKEVKWEYKYDGPKCDSPALYFYSCKCGKAGTEMFTVGEARHFWSACLQIEGDRHRRKCWNCDLVDISPCYGGYATCRYRAECEGCLELYGTVDPNNHTGSWSWVKTAETHGKYYNCCGVTVEVEKHVWENGACSACGYPCDHTGGTATCTKKAVCVSCGVEYGDLNAENHDPAAEWTQENGKHYHVCKNGCGTHLDEAACAGGTATCMKKAECAVCGGEYGTVNAENHDPAAEWTQENGKHYHVCKNGCGTHLDEAACSGGTANCMMKAECAVCGGEYGAVDPNKHDPSAEWTQENGKHYHVCKNGCGTHLDEAACSGGTANCMMKAECAVCGGEYGAVDPNKHDPSAEWTQENGKHYHVCKNGCGTHVDEAACSGGGADCQHKAVCRICQKEYGELGMHNFSENLGWAATCTEDGQKAHRICADCRVLVLMDGEKATQEELIIPATGHDWGEAEWIWNEDGTAAAVRFTCKNDGTHIEEPAVDMTHRTTPAGCTRAGETVYTAKATFENGLYTDSRTTVLDALGHEVTHVAALAPTETEAGHTEHWVCTRCGLYFGDEALTQPILQEDTILPATGKGTPTTGDSGNLTLWAALLAASGGAWLALLRRRRERQ